MASETSELTFVRCPSCRSLVPASASRCRICNNPLEASGGADGGESAKAAGRVRQRTISASAEQLLAAAEAEEAQSAPPVAAQPSSPAHEVSEEIDPLSAYLEELEEEPVAQAAAPAAASAPAGGALDHLDMFDDFDLEPAPVASVPADQASQDAHANHDELDVMTALMDEELIPEPAVAAVSEPVAAPPIEAAPILEKAPVVAAPPIPEAVVESPPPPPKREPTPPPRPPANQPQRGHANQKHAQHNQDNRSQRDARHGDTGGHERRDGQRHEKRGEENRKGGHPQHSQQGAKHQERHTERSNDRPQVQSGGPKMGKMRPGRLFGWLVSFESPDGRAIELREGKFFVTGTSIRGTDLVVEDPSISTPHALMSVSGDNGLMIQDLMSDRGVFHRTGDRGQYQREDGVFHLEHGDWVRFGDVEFLVTIVPSNK